MAALAHVRQDRAVDSLGTKHVDVEQVRDVRRGEGFDIADGQVSGVVNDDIQRLDCARVAATALRADCSDWTSRAMVRRARPSGMASWRSASARSVSTSRMLA